MTAPNGPTMFGDIDIDGDNAQNVIGSEVNGDLVYTTNKFVRGTPSMFLGSDEVFDRVRCYVPALNHGVIEKTLRADQAVILTGPPGSGRETSAIAAMRRLRPDADIRRFSLEDEDTEEIRVTGGCGYLVHASDGGLSRLGRCVDAVRAAGAHLAVIGGTDIKPQPYAAFLSVVRVDPPPAIEVFRRRVGMRGFAEWAGWDEAPALLEGGLPSDAHRLAELVERLEGKAERREEVAHAYRDWADELREWFEQHRDAQERALLVAAATLAPAADQTQVYSAAASLAERLKIAPDGRGLAWCPVTRLRELLRAEEQHDAVVFRKYGFASSVLRHTLADYPLAQGDLLEWLSALPTDDAIPAARRNDLAETFTDLAAEHGAAWQLIDSARRWGSADLADLSFIALSRTCLHPRVGGRVRDALYEWSRGARTPQTLKLTIARVCETLGQTYPSIALTRLKHLATYGDRHVLEQVLLAAQGLVASGNRTDVLLAALTWCSGATGRERLSLAAGRRRRRAGAMLFLHLAALITDEGSPLMLLADPAVDPSPGWRAALDLSADGGIADHVVESTLRQWLDAALSEPRLSHHVSSVLVEAARPSAAAAPGMFRRTPPAMRDTARADIVIDVVRRWAATDHSDASRRAVKEAIVLPLTRPWWLRGLKLLYVGARTAIEERGDRKGL